MKYIDADRLKVEIERRLVRYDTAYTSAGLELKELLSFVTSLRQEQPVVELEKEVKSYIKDNFTITDEVAQIPEEDRMYSMGQDDMVAFAKHFYELGQLVMKHSITNRAKVALAKCHSFPDTTYFAIGEVLSFILGRTNKEEL